MLGPNIVFLNQITHYLVKHPENNRKTRKLVIVAGTCNNVPFEATGINDPDLSTTLDIFREDHLQFSKLEIQSLQRRIKMAPPMDVFDLRDDLEAKTYQYFHTQMQEKYYGKKIYFNVPFGRKDEAKRLGAKWDIGEKKWFIFTSSPTLLQIEKYFNREDS